jgi:type VI protein secretion system component Hcp
MKDDESTREPEEQTEDLDMPPEDAEAVKGGGKVKLTDITIVKTVDKSSPLL